VGGGGGAQNTPPPPRQNGKIVFGQIEIES
jgi:hypothetical protein